MFWTLEGILLYLIYIGILNIIEKLFKVQNIWDKHV